jgi:hypothetical protein
MWVGLGLLALLIAYVVFGFVRRAQRRKYLLGKYGDERLVELMMAGKIIQGMTEEQLIDSWGRPVDVSTKVYRMKTTKTFKYGQTGRNRFRNRVTVENGVVVGWDSK